MQFHLDIAVNELDAGVAWALETGATLADYQPQDDVWVMLDPAGHPFCLFPADLARNPRSRRKQSVYFRRLSRR